MSISQLIGWFGRLIEQICVHFLVLSQVIYNARDLICSNSIFSLVKGLSTYL